VVEAKLPARSGEGPGAVAGAVVGHDTGDLDTEAAVIIDGLVEEGDGALLFLISPDLGEGQSRGVVDRDVDELVTGATAFPLLAITGDAVAGPDKSPEFLDIDMDELAGLLALVSAHRLGRLQIAYPAQSQTAKDAADGGRRHIELCCNLLARVALPAQRLDGGARGWRGLAWR